jgi:hypothetical protein
MESSVIYKHDRLIEETNLMGMLLKNSIKNRKTTIGYGPTGSWFFHNPQNHHVNMDPGMSLLMGLQNSRCILLHEIGHSQITDGRSPRILEIQKKLKEIGTQTKDGDLEVENKKAQEASDLSKELSYRENFWQLSEDCCVNTYAEIEGEHFPNDVVTAMMRCYMIIDKSRQNTEDLMKNAKKRAFDPQDLLDPETKKKNEELQAEISKRLKAIANATVIERGMFPKEETHQWEILGLTPNDITLELCHKFSNPENPEAVGNIQPALTSSRIDLIDTEKFSESVNKCAKKRNQLIDTYYDIYLKELVDQLVIPPPQQGQGKGKGEGKGGKSTISTPPLEDDSKQEGPKDYDKILKGDAEAKPKSPVEDEYKDLDAAQKEHEEKIKREEEIRKEQERSAQEQAEAVKDSMGSKTPLERLPTDCGSYAEAVEKCEEQINYAAAILRTIALMQNKKKNGARDMLPDPRRGIVPNFQSIINRKEKEALQEKIQIADRKHFEQKDKTQTIPSLTEVRFYIDGSGSMCGIQAERTMLTLIIFNEASKRVPEIQISAVYSGREKTYSLIAGGHVNPEEEKTVAALLQKGYAGGDNEICAQGLHDLTELSNKTMHNKTKVGMIHTIFLTDGGTAPNEEKNIRNAITAMLDANPLSTFDTIIVDGSTNNPFNTLHNKIETKHARQMPTLTTCQNTDEIATSICTTLTTRIRQFKSFAPITPEERKRQLRNTMATLAMQM